jgi:hypothetical protein
MECTRGYSQGYEKLERLRKNGENKQKESAVIKLLIYYLIIIYKLKVT